ncbi:MAG TPA: Na+ dependent nucleoside transporter [Flavobacterium sp.]|nr:Na+ dependent nucleoside transporter [Flavobacterium sp.]
MIKKLIFLLALFCSFHFINAQQIEKKWQSTTNKNDYLELQNGTYKFVVSQNNINQKGDYIIQDNVLFLFENGSDAPTKRFVIQTKSNVTLVLKNKGKSISFQATNGIKNTTSSTQLIKSQGISYNSIYRGFLGMISLIAIAYFFSNNKKAINWKTVGLGIIAQFILAISVLKIPFIKKIFEFVGNLFVLILDFTKAGSEFLLGNIMNIESYGFIFLFQVLPTIIFFSALTSLLFYLGIIQIIVKVLAKGLTKLLDISGAESLSVAGNIFIGQTEAPLLIKAYLDKMNKSEILLVMVGGMATVAGGVMAAYIGFLGGNDPLMRLEFAKHLLAASVMAAPGAVVISKILYPQTEPIDTNAAVSKEKIGFNILDAIATGTTEGLKLAANVAAMLLVFIALITMINYSLAWIGSWSGLNHIIATYTTHKTFSIEAILGFIFSPLMWIIGVAKEDIMLMGQLLGIKLASSEFVGYIQLAELKNITNNIHLTYEKSVIMATYMLCGFANFASIGIQIGGIGSLAPCQRKTLSELGLKAVIGGSIASLLSATIAGIIIG